MALSAFILAVLTLPCRADNITATTDATTQERIAWLQENAIPIRTLDADDTDYSDLIRIGRRIGNARVVTLGEPTHGDGEAFRAKTRLIRYLHQRMDFSVLAWESNLLECRMADIALRTDKPVDVAAAIGIYSVWSAARETQPLLEYVRATQGTAKPLEMSGFDCQSRGGMFAPLFDFLDRAYPHTLSAGDRSTLQEMHRMVSAGSYAKLSEQQRQPYQDLLSRLIVQVGQPDERIDQRERMLMHRTLLNLWDFQHAYSVTLETIRAGGEAGNRRDISMGNNLAWLAYQYHPERKIVAWAANTHLARDIAALEGFGNFRNMFDTYRPMGQVALELMGEDIYSIGVLAYSGESRRVNRGFAIPVKAMPGSLEELLHLTGHKYLFIDLKHTPQDHWLRQDLVAGAFGYSPMRGDWSAVFDAFIFIDEMLPATPVRRD